MKRRIKKHESIFSFQPYKTDTHSYFMSVSSFTTVFSQMNSYIFRIFTTQRHDSACQFPCLLARSHTECKLLNIIAFFCHSFILHPRMVGTCFHNRCCWCFCHCCCWINPFDTRTFCGTWIKRHFSSLLTFSFHEHFSKSLK